jgi:ATP-dependent DNA ligase
MVTLYNKSSKGKTKMWSIWLEGNEVVKEWGYLDGKTQVTRDSVKGKNIGKANETSDEEQAQFEMDRAIRLKREEGYTEDLNAVQANIKPEINWETSELPDCFAPSKPLQQIDDDLHKQLRKDGRAIYTRKWNGQRIFIVCGDKQVRIYSRRLEDKTAHFPHHVKFFEQFIGQGLILDAELHLNDDPDAIKELMGSKPEKAIERQNTSHGIPTAVIFDILFINKAQSQYSYWDRLLFATNLIENAKIKNWDIAQTVIPLDGFDDIKAKQVHKHIPPSWEGVVLWDASSTMNIRWDGKPDRKSGAYKIKDFKECDLICYEWATGKGKLSNNVATLKLGAYDDKGNLVHICESGSGLDEESRAEIFKISPNKKTKFAVEIKYEERTPGGSLRLPIFLRVRTDKKIKECLIEDIK